MSLSNRLGLLGRKVGMMRIFTDDGDAVPVTVLDVSNNRVAQIKTGAEGVYCGILPTLGVGIALKIWDGATRASEVAMATVLRHLGVLDARRYADALNPPVRNAVGARIGDIRPAASWLGAAA